MKILLLISVILMPAQFPVMASDTKPEIEVGQVWKYHNRENESASRVTVVRIETLKGYGRIVHVFVDNLQIKCSRYENGIMPSLTHSPLTEEAFWKTVTELEGITRHLPEFEEGYQTWRDAFDAGEAGVFTITVDRIVVLMEETINQ
jgi:hypothetical protein